MTFMAGHLSGELADGLDHSWRPSGTGQHRHPHQTQRNVITKADIHDSQCMASFGFGVQQLNHPYAANAPAFQWFQWLRAPKNTKTHWHDRFWSNATVLCFVYFVRFGPILLQK